MKNTSHWVRPALISAIYLLSSLAGHCFWNPEGRGDGVAVAASPDARAMSQCTHGPLGEAMRATGTKAKASPLGFSTKCHDDETDLPYYGYRYYHASSGRWISRDPVGRRGGINLYCFVHNEPGIKVDPDGRITVVPGPAPPTKGACGTYAKYWTFILGRPAPCDGYIVQQVTTRDIFALCGKTPKVNNFVFWEAWPISAGMTQSTSVGTGPYGTSYTDADIVINPANSWGYHAVRGDIKFFCSSTVGELQESGFEPGRVPASGNLLSTYNAPGWWDLPSDNGEAAASRFASSSWNCCCDKANQYNNFTFRP
jgi:RHS repeat-associated protein